jgi:hypothetical protein
MQAGMLCCSQYRCWNKAEWVIQWGDEERDFFWSCPGCVGSLLPPDEESAVYPIGRDHPDRGQAQEGER